MFLFLDLDETLLSVAAVVSVTEAAQETRVNLVRVGFLAQVGFPAPCGADGTAEAKILFARNKAWAQLLYVQYNEQLVHWFEHNGL